MKQTIVHLLLEINLSEITDFDSGVLFAITMTNKDPEIEHVLKVFFGNNYRQKITQTYINKFKQASKQ